MKTKELFWYVYNYNPNSNAIERYNVAGGSGFRGMLRNLLKTYIDKASFAEALKGEMMRRFWSRAEWELVIEIENDGRIFLVPWCGCRNPENVKIDITNNTDFEWSLFAKLHTSRQIYKDRAKIDVYDQLRFVWDDFVDYCWNSGVYKRRKRCGETKEE